MSNQGVGQWGEDRAVTYLENKGFDIKRCNYETPVGECDILARDGEKLVFVEVKTRKQRQFGSPQMSVTKEKREHLRRVARYYLGGLEEPVSCRFDVIAITLDGTESEINHIQNAFGGRE
ncbi:MAG: YraN family protein [bacterium]